MKSGISLGSICSSNFMVCAPWRQQHSHLSARRQWSFHDGSWDDPHLPCWEWDLVLSVEDQVSDQVVPSSCPLSSLVAYHASLEDWGRCESGMGLLHHCVVLPLLYQSYEGLPTTCQLYKWPSSLMYKVYHVCYQVHGTTPSTIYSSSSHEHLGWASFHTHHEPWTLNMNTKTIWTLLCISPVLPNVTISVCCALLTTPMALQQGFSQTLFTKSAQMFRHPRHMFRLAEQMFRCHVPGIWYIGACYQLHGTNGPCGPDTRYNWEHTNGTTHSSNLIRCSDTLSKPSDALNTVHWTLNSNSEHSEWCSSPTLTSHLSPVAPVWWSQCLASHKAVLEQCSLNVNKCPDTLNNCSGLHLFRHQGTKCVAPWYMLPGTLHHIYQVSCTWCQAYGTMYPNILNKLSWSKKAFIWSEHWTVWTAFSPSLRCSVVIIGRPHAADISVCSVVIPQAEPITVFTTNDKVFTYPEHVFNLAEQLARYLVTYMQCYLQGTYQHWCQPPGAWYQAPCTMYLRGSNKCSYVLNMPADDPNLGLWTLNSSNSVQHISWWPAMVSWCPHILCICVTTPCGVISLWQVEPEHRSFNMIKCSDTLKMVRLAEQMCRCQVPVTLAHVTAYMVPPSGSCNQLTCSKHGFIWCETQTLIQ